MTQQSSRGRLTDKEGYLEELSANINSSPQADQKQLEHILGLVEEGKKDSTLVFGGARHGDQVCHHISIDRMLVDT